MGDLINDIEKYLRGEMSSSEMHQLEKKALNDPFLSDALDGMDNHEPNEVDDDLRKLSEAIKERIESDNKSKSIWYWPLRIAAGVLLIALTSYILYTLVDDNNGSSHLALNKEKVEVPSNKHVEQDSITSTNSEKESAAESAIVKSEPEKVEKTDTKKFNAYSAKPTVQALQPQKSPEPETKVAEEQEEVISKNSYSYNDTNEPSPSTSSPVILKEDKKVSNRAKRKSEDLAGVASSDAMAGNGMIQQRIITGKVLDEEDGTPMPGVTVTIKGQDKGTTTNLEGFYQLQVADTLKNDLVFSFVGMQSAEIPISNKDSINVSLSPDFESLSEVVVVGYASPSDEGPVKERENIYEIAEPVGGKKAFKTYLADNMHYPVQALENKIEGRVTVQFFVEISGMLSDFRVTRSLGFGCDDEVIRLIRQGPKWTPTKRNEVPLRNKVKVKVKFKLPQ